MAGYSKKSLVDKLGLKAGFRAMLLNPPPHYADLLGVLPANVTLFHPPAGSLDFVQYFTTRRAQLEADFPGLKQALAPAGMLWVCWPKRASKAPTDLTEDLVRAVGLAHGLVDVKVAAVDETWSALKFVYRLADR